MKNNLVKVNLNEQMAGEGRIREDHQKWIDLLVGDNESRQREFDEILAKSKGTVFAVMKYRRILKSRGRGHQYTSEHLKVANNMPESYLQKILQEMFLEPVTADDISLLYELASKQGYNDMNKAMEELFKRHQQDSGARMISIALSL